MPSLYESRRKANSSTNSRVISLCRSSGTCVRGLAADDDNVDDEEDDGDGDNGDDVD